MSAELPRPFSEGGLHVSTLSSFILDWPDSRLFPSPVGEKGEEGWVSAPLVRLVPQTPFLALVLCSQQSGIFSPEPSVASSGTKPPVGCWVGGGSCPLQWGESRQSDYIFIRLAINLILAFLLFHPHFQTYLVLPILNRLGILSCKPGWVLAYNSAFLGLLNH